MTLRSILSTVFISFLPLLSIAQAGMRDTTFNINGEGANGSIAVVKVQEDGKILVGGNFTSFNGQVRNRLARLHEDGTLDEDFNADVNGLVKTICAQADGKVVVGGEFSMVNGTPRNKFARLLVDGSLDPSFIMGSGFGGTGSVNSIMPHPQGGFMVAGHFGSYNATPRSNIARILADGALATDFVPAPGTNDKVNHCLVQPDGAVILLGDFTQCNYQTRYRVARLLPDGSLDTSFNSGTGAQLEVFSGALLPDGKFLIVGKFNGFNSISYAKVARVNPDGTVDATFTPSFNPNYSVFAVTLQQDGKILVAGDFLTVNSLERNRIARLDPNGPVDPIFDPIEGANNGARSVATDLQNRILLAGNFTSYQGHPQGRLVRIEPGEVGIGIREVDRSVRFSVYPVPASTSVTVVLEYATAGSLRLHTIDGREVMQQRITAQVSDLELSHLPAGIYLAEITSAEGHLGTVRIVKD